MNYPDPQYGQPVQPGYAPQQIPQAPGGYQQPNPYAQPAPQQYGQPAPQQFQQPYAPPVQQYGQPQQAPGQPAQPLANGSIDDFYSQPTGGGGPGVSWKGKPDGYTVQGVVPRDVTNSDVSQEVGAPNTNEAGKPQFYRDGRPKFVMAVPLQVPASHEYPEGEARLFVRGQLRDELSRAMAEAGAEGAPKAGAVITVTLVQRKQGRGAIPQNVFAVTYTPAGAQAPAVNQGQPVQQPVQQYQQPQAPVQQQPVQQYQQPQAVPAQQPVQQYAPQPGLQQVQPGIPQGGQPQGQPPVQQMQPPAGLDADQAALLARLTAGQQGGQPGGQQGAPAA